MRWGSELGERASVLCLLAVILALTCALFAPQFSDPGPGMDEGILVAYPTFIEHGEVPGRDFETFYGPGGPYLGAGAFEVLGAHVWVERAIGLLFRLLLVGSIFALLLYWGRTAAFVGSIASALLMLQVGLLSLAWIEAVGLALLGLALAAHAAATDRARQAAPIVAGAVSGLAVAFRPDIAPAAIIPAAVVLAGVGGLRRFALGFVLGVIPTLVWAGVVGPHGIDRLLSDLSASRPSRSLPLPPLRSSLAPVLIATTAIALLLLFAGALRLRKDRLDPTGWRVLALGVFSILLLPATLERAGAQHVLTTGCVVVGFAPAALLELAGPIWRRPTIAAKLAAGAAGAFCAFAVLYASWPTVKHKDLGLGRQVAAYDVVNGDRSFPIGSEPEARDLNALIAKLDRIGSPGETLFVGPANLRLANYNDTFVYYLLPQLRPATFFNEVNPGATNGPDSSLAEELTGADFLLLTGRYDQEIVEPGPDAPMHVVESSFCVVEKLDTYELLRRCDKERS